MTQRGAKTDYVLVGGGSGGHIVPLIPVAEALHNIDPKLIVAHIGHKKDPINSVTRDSQHIHDVYEVSAGKFRRYHGQSWLNKIIDLKTLFFNIRDFFRFARGVIQSWVLLGKLKPKAIFMKGGYVCANVGIAARIRKIPYMTHDSDAMVSLAHRVIAKNAAMHTTAMPPKYYEQFDQSKTIQVGVPIRSDFALVTPAAQVEAKNKLGIPKDALFVLVTGGGLGALNINNAVLSSLEGILKAPDVFLGLITGAKLYDRALNVYGALPEDIQKRTRLESFTHDMKTYSAAADVIVTRASATALSEFGAQTKACIIVPNPVLSGGHQLKNAKALQERGAVHIVNEERLSDDLAGSIKSLLSDKEERMRLGRALNKAVLPGAADRIAQLLVKIGNDGKI